MAFHQLTVHLREKYLDKVFAVLITKIYHEHIQN